MFARKGHSLATEARLAQKKGRRLNYVATNVAKTSSHYKQLEKKQPFSIKQILAKLKDQGKSKGTEHDMHHIAVLRSLV